MHKSNTGTGVPSSSATEQTAGSGMTHEELMKKLSANPKFKEVKKPGEVFTIVGAKP